MESSIFTQISLVIAVAAVIAVIMRVLKQPLIMSYIVSGIIVGPSVFNIVHAQEAFNSFSELGITLLLFIIGLGLNAGVIRSLGRVSLLTATTILVMVGGAGFLTSVVLGFNTTTSVILGVSLFFSSTIIILKVLSDNKELTRLYAQIAIGVILVDDVIATLALIIVSAMGTHQAFTPSTVGLLGLKSAALGIGLAVLSIKVMPRLTKMIAKSQELLFLFSIAWGMSVATLFEVAGFSHEVGALFAGVCLAGLPYATEMASKLKPLRDFFIVIFFVSLGETFSFGALKDSIIPALILSAVVMLAKPFFVLLALGAQGYTKLTSFKAAIHLSQISEFSIILVILAAQTHVIESRAVAVITLVALITIGISTYLMKYDEQLYRLLEHHLRHFERSAIKERTQRRPLYPVVLIGYHKGGHEFLKTFRDMKQRYLVVDYDPEIIDSLEAQGIRHAYGDATDEDFLDEINIARAELVVSMMTEVATNLILLQYIRLHNPDTSFICHANSYKEAAELYEHGASYVSLPHYIGSERVSSFIKRHGIDHNALASYRDKHLITIGRQALKS
ncbi:cation:proton antiporter [Microbacteriaceae bacterium]|nr:cation:proton antiporter [Candidatus Saccharibacteria bacterium]